MCRSTMHYMRMALLLLGALSGVLAMGGNELPGTAQDSALNLGRGSERENRVPTFRDKARKGLQFGLIVGAMTFPVMTVLSALGLGNPVRIFKIEDQIYPDKVRNALLKHGIGKTFEDIDEFKLYLHDYNSETSERYPEPTDNNGVTETSLRAVLTELAKELGLEGDLEDHFKFDYRNEPLDQIVKRDASYQIFDWKIARPELRIPATIGVNLTVLTLITLYWDQTWGRGGSASVGRVLSTGIFTGGMTSMTLLASVFNVTEHQLPHTIVLALSGIGTLSTLTDIYYSWKFQRRFRKYVGKSELIPRFTGDLTPDEKKEFLEFKNKGYYLDGQENIQLTIKNPRTAFGFFVMSFISFLPYKIKSVAQMLDVEEQNALFEYIFIIAAESGLVAAFVDLANLFCCGVEKVREVIGSDIEVERTIVSEETGGTPKLELTRVASNAGDNAENVVVDILEVNPDEEQEMPEKGRRGASLNLNAETLSNPVAVEGSEVHLPGGLTPLTRKASQEQSREEPSASRSASKLARDHLQLGGDTNTGTTIILHSDPDFVEKHMQKHGEHRQD